MSNHNKYDIFLIHLFVSLKSLCHGAKMPPTYTVFNVRSDYIFHILEDLPLFPRGAFNVSNQVDTIHFIEIRDISIS